MATREQNERKQKAKRVVAWVLVALLLGSSVFASIVGMVHFE